MTDIPYLDNLRIELVLAARRMNSRARRRRLIIVPVAAVVGLLVAGGIAISDLRWPLLDDVPPGTSVATGTVNNEGWLLTARKTDQGLCVGIQYGPGWSEGCGFPSVDERPVQLQIESREGATFILGHVRSDVERITIHLENGASVSERTLQEEGYDVRFYVHAFEGSVEVDRVVGYNSVGEPIGTARR
ncbi:MAG: hypothetical protein M3280_09280 [Actinomycetota bacterium]|nr:hypothetical protein [Actinomycetota bacterium]